MRNCWIHYCCREGDRMDILLLQRGELAEYITAAGRGTNYMYYFSRKGIHCCCREGNGWIHYCCREGDWLDTLMLQGEGLAGYITALGRGTG